MSVTYGEPSWEDSTGGNKTSNKDIWMKLDNGSNEMRLLTKPYPYFCHTYKKEGDPGYGQKINCSKINGSCPLCDAGDKAKKRYLVGVLDRRTNAFKILDISSKIYDDLKKLNANKHWGDPLKYDISIEKDKNAPPASYYAVQPLSKSPLSAEDQLVRDDAPLDILVEKTTPPTPEYVQQRIDRINNPESFQQGKPNQKPAQKPVAKPAPKAVAKPSVSDETDDEFPDYGA